MGHGRPLGTHILALMDDYGAIVHAASANSVHCPLGGGSSITPLTNWPSGPFTPSQFSNFIPQVRTAATRALLGALGLAAVPVTGKSA